MTQATTFAVHLHEYANRYFPDFRQAEVNVALTGAWRRPRSTLYRFQLSAGGVQRFVLIKVPTSPGETGVQVQDEGPSRRDRPRLASETDPTIKFRLEYVAFTTVHSYFQNLQDPRFGTIRILDLLSKYGAIVMEEAKDPSLRQLFAKASFSLPPLKSSATLEAAFRNAGAWLHAYHALHTHVQAETRHARRADFIESITPFTDFLTDAVGDAMFFQQVALTTTEQALDALPETLPLGLGHGDFAMRNILVGPQGRVTLLDTLARWRTPIYEDVAYFLIALKTTWPQVLSQGLAFSASRLAHYEREFLSGYFGPEPVDFGVIRLFEIQALLDKWSATVARLALSARGRLQCKLVNRYFRRSADQLLRMLVVQRRPAESLQRATAEN